VTRSSGYAERSSFASEGALREAANTARSPWGFVGVTVTTGLSVGFDWEPPCAVAFLIVQGEAGDQWIISTDNQQWDDPAYQSNRFAPPVTYGTNPQGVDDTFGPEDLFSGLTYELYLYRVLPENSSAVCQIQFGQVCLLALVEFVR